MYPLLGPKVVYLSLSKWPLSFSFLFLCVPVGLAELQGCHRCSPSPAAGYSLALRPVTTNVTRGRVRLGIEKITTILHSIHISPTSGLGVK